MAFNLRLGVPEIEAVWNDYVTRNRAGALGKDEAKFFKKPGKAFYLLAENPRHNSLASHEIADLTLKLGFKVFQSYLENHTPAAGRIFWTYGPAPGDITVLGIEPHPENQ